MLFFDGALALLAVGVWLFCLIDVITTPESEVRNLPKLVWLLIVIVLVDIGAIAWLIAGRNWNGSKNWSGANSGGMAYKGNRNIGDRYPEYDRPGRFRPSNPDDDEEFLAQLRARAEEQRRRAREAKRAEEDPPSTQG